LRWNIISLTFLDLVSVQRGSGDSWNCNGGRIHYCWRVLELRSLSWSKQEGCRKNIIKEGSGAGLERKNIGIV
jgi:hypothetical protein